MCNYFVGIVNFVPVNCQKLYMTVNTGFDLDPEEDPIVCPGSATPELCQRHRQSPRIYDQFLAMVAIFHLYELMNRMN